MNQTESFMLTVSVPDHASRRLAVLRRPARPEGAGRPTVVWLGGFMSTMQSGKALALDAWAEAIGRGFTRFDYSGHGASDGAFEDGTIGQWLEDALAVLREATAGPLLLVGSSMGGWIALLAARALAASGEGSRLAGLVLIAPAVDFTEALIWDRVPPEVRDTIVRDGLWHSTGTDGGYPITRALIEDGRRHLLLGSPIDAHGPVHILQGMRDDAVPWRHALALVEHLAQDAVSFTLVKDGDHRLSRPEDLTRLVAAVEALA